MPCCSCDALLPPASSQDQILLSDSVWAAAQEIAKVHFGRVSKCRNAGREESLTSAGFLAAQLHES